MDKAKGKIHIETTKMGNKSKGRIYIPADLVKDSLFKFEDKEKVKIEIQKDGTLVVSST